MLFSKPQEVTKTDTVFGARSLDTLMPKYADIPAEFKSYSNPWVKWQSDWFFNGLKSFPEPKAGINQHTAMAHLKAIQSSFEPKHEHKQAAVAYLASLWFEEP